MLHNYFSDVVRLSFMDNLLILETASLSTAMTCPSAPKITSVLSSEGPVQNGS